MKSYLETLANSTTHLMKRIPYTKSIRDAAGTIGLKKLTRITKNLKDLDYNLAHTHSIHKRDVGEQYEKRIIKEREWARIKADWAKMRALRGTWE
jgi:hypothetical protein